MSHYPLKDGPRVPRDPKNITGLMQGKAIRGGNNPDREYTNQSLMSIKSIAALSNV